MMKQIFITTSFLLATTISIFGQTSENQSQSEVDHFLNWQNKSIGSDDAFGVETEKTYNELLKDKKSTTVIVAVIDGGIDITHEDLKENIWINKDEIPDNGIDDDNNGYIDDIHGWNYLGNANGENISYENLEITRIYREFKPKYENAKKRKLNGKDLENYDLYKLAEKKYKKEYKMATRQAIGFRKFTSKYNDTYHKITEILNDTLLTIEKLDSLKLANKKLKKDIKFIYPFVQYGFSMDMFKEFETEITKQLDYHLNLEFTPRDIIGDNQDDFNTVYGNNNVYGPHAFHGTHVSGIIAAIRNNDLGINGIAGDVKIMALKVVPDGDERDKDVAKAIRYAADNGARIINMSFGKELSSHKHYVDEAIQYAQEKGVLLIHAAGNDANNIDEIKQYPTKNISANKQLNTWITVGASSLKKDKSLPANFSNYGKTMVDVFAPGVRIKSLAPENNYEYADGTSMAAPVVSGVAALILSYYPELTASEVKEIILKSVNKCPELEVEKPGYARRKKKMQFGELSVTGGVVSAYNALKLADSYKK